MDDGRIQVHRVNMYADSEGMCKLPLEYCTTANFEVLAVRFRFLQGQPLFATEAFVGYAGGPQPSTERVFFDLTDPSCVDQEPWDDGNHAEDGNDLHTDTFVFTGPLFLDSDKGTPLGYVHAGDRSSFFTPLVEHGVHRGDFPVFGFSSFTSEETMWTFSRPVIRMECTIRVLDGDDDGPTVYGTRMMRPHPVPDSAVFTYYGHANIQYVFLDVASEAPVTDGCVAFSRVMAVPFAEWEEVESGKPGWRTFKIMANFVPDHVFKYSCFTTAFAAQTSDTLWSRMWLVAE
jgi:hypothetical protein